MSRPLAGRRVLLTRRPEQSSALASRLRGLGAEVVEVPAIGIAPPEDTGPLDAALRGLADYDWVAFTSANAVAAVGERLETLGLSWPGAARPRIASVGPATSDALPESLPGVAVSLMPEKDFRADGLLEAFAAHDLNGRRVLVPASDRARDVLPRGLAGRGARVDVVVAYRTVTPGGLAEKLTAALAAGFDVAVFASPSAVEGMRSAAGSRAAGLPAAVIGPVTERAARAAGFDVRVVAAPSTADGLVDALLRRFA